MADRKDSSASIVSFTLSVFSAVSLVLSVLGVSIFEDGVALAPVCAVLALGFGLLGRARREPRRVFTILGITVSALVLAGFVVLLGWSASRA